jgi:hypothetical protein
MDELKKELQTLQESFDQGLESLEITMAQAFQRQEAQAKRHFEELVTRIDEMALADTQRHERVMVAYLPTSLKFKVSSAGKFPGTMCPIFTSDSYLLPDSDS